MNSKINTGTLKGIFALGGRITGALDPEHVSEDTRWYLDEFQQLKETQAQIDQLIQAFNSGVERVFEQGGVQGLLPYLTEMGYFRMQQNYQRWKSQGVTALILEQYTFLTFSLTKGGEAKAYTQEDWAFMHGTARQAGGGIDLYSLVKKEDGWKIDGVEFFHKD